MRAAAIRCGVGYWCNSLSTHSAETVGGRAPLPAPKHAGQTGVQLVDPPRGLLALRLQRRRQVSPRGELLRRGVGFRRPFHDRKAGPAGQTVDRIGLAFGEVHVLIIAVPFRFPNGNGLGKGKLPEKPLQVDGVLAGRIEANVEMHVFAVTFRSRSSAVGTVHNPPATRER